MSEQELSILNAKMRGIKEYLQDDLILPDTSSEG
jgi:hypothetical protein